MDPTHLTVPFLFDCISSRDNLCLGKTLNPKDALNPKP
jgi:hypothetical protein